MTSFWLFGAPSRSQRKKNDCFLLSSKKFNKWLMRPLPNVSGAYQAQTDAFGRGPSAWTCNALPLLSLLQSRQAE
jgi:hypothetical protein